MLAGLYVLNGCTNLSENVLDEASASGLSDRQAADGIIAPVYARLPDIFLHTNYFALQEISTDEAILPYRGGTDWGDNGIYLALHQHTHTSTDPNLRNTWNLILQGVSRSITAINTLPTLNDPVSKTYLAEARGMRAYYSEEVPGSASIISKRAQLFRSSQTLLKKVNSIITLALPMT